MESYSIYPFCDWLISLSVISLRFIYVIPYCRISFLFKAELYSIVCVYHILVIYSFINADLICFSVSAVVNKAAMNMCVQIWFWYPTSNYFGYIPKSKISGSYASLVTQTVKNLPAVQETQLRSLGREDPLEKGMATHSSFLAWRIPRTEEPGGLQPMQLQESDTTQEVNHQHLHRPHRETHPRLQSSYLSEPSD